MLQHNAVTVTKNNVAKTHNYEGEETKLSFSGWMPDEFFDSPPCDPR
jgi:hypothetical protein